MAFDSQCKYFIEQKASKPFLGHKILSEDKESLLKKCTGNVPRILLQKTTLLNKRTDGKRVQVGS